MREFDEQNRVNQFGACEGFCEIPVLQGREGGIPLGEDGSIECY